MAGRIAEYLANHQDEKLTNEVCAKVYECELINEGYYTD